MAANKAKRATTAPINQSNLDISQQMPKNENQGLNEDSFKNLRDRISAQLKNTDQNVGKKEKPIQAKQKNISGNDRGKKRSADGEVLLAQDVKVNVNPTGAQPVDGYGSEAELRKALKELGGTDEDLDLINGADSESEFEGDDTASDSKSNSKKQSTTNLQDGLDSILKEIAIARKSQVDSSHGSEEEEEEQESIAEPVPDITIRSKPKPVTTTLSKPSNDRSRNVQLKCQPRPDWFNISSYSVDHSTQTNSTPKKQTVDRFHSYAKSLLATENETFQKAQRVSSSQAFYNTVVASGTLSDKISALTLAVQESPLHNTKALESLINLASKRSRSQAIDVLRALKDLFAQGSLLPSDRRLHAFYTQPGLLQATARVKSWNVGDKLPNDLQESDLICWAFEDWLKQQYFGILKLLETWCNDEIEFAKGRAISYVYELLKEKPEQEANLLRLLVDKLGDPVKKMASQASYLLMQLLSTHPAMKMVVVTAIENDFIFRPGQSMHGKYYAAVTLNQTALSMREEDVANTLLKTYFGLFTTLLKPSTEKEIPETTLDSQSRAQRQRKKKVKTTNSQVEELREKLISAVLTGVNRAYPYVGTDQKIFTDHLETLFKITHSANFNTAIQALLLIQQLTNTHSAAADRFYRTLYESLLDIRLITASKQQLYLNLLHRSLKADTNAKRVKAFVKRLLQILSLHEPPFICGAFFLIKDLEKTYPSLMALVDQAEDHDNEVEVFRDVDEDANMSNTDQADNLVKNNSYDGTKRAPEHANADNTCTWDVLPFVAHYHPTVTISADSYLHHSKLPGKPDLTLHTLIHFLDRFVYKNPKFTGNRLRGSSIMQPMATDDTHAVLIGISSQQTAPVVNTDEFKNKKDQDVAAEEVFFHKYFNALGKDSKSKKRKQRDLDEENSVGDAGEDAIWKAMIDSAPDLEGEDSEDEDLDMSDFEDEMGDGEGLSDDDGADLDEDDDEEVDVEAGIFDDSDDALNDILNTEDQKEQDSESDFAGLASDADEASMDKNRKEKKEAEKGRRKKMKALPTFASAADYAKMLEDDEDEDYGV